MLHLELTYTVRYDRMEKNMLLESLETIPFIIVMAFAYGLMILFYVA